MINFTNEPSDTHVKTLQEESLEDSTEKSMEILLDMANQNVHNALKKFQDTKNNMRRQRS
jgi:hypothetical protein